jgi:propanol-preferring alcohol dehydrogenase
MPAARRACSEWRWVAWWRLREEAAMKAWVLDRPGPIESGPLRLVDLPRPEPAAGEVRLHVQVCGVCRTDLHIAEGDLPLHRSPLVLGHEIVGIVDAVGEGVSGVAIGDLVGVTWLGRTCGTCQYCRSGRENYCADFRATGWDVDGGFAEYTIVDVESVLLLAGIDLPRDDLAPLMCPGVAGHGAFRLTGAANGQRLGLYGFGPTADYVLRVARHLGLEVYVSSRSEANQKRAEVLGAAWAGDAARHGMPVQLQASVVFPPAGPLVEAALRDLEVGGVLVLAPVAMSKIEILDYSTDLWGRDIRTLYNVNQRDSRDFLRIAGEVNMVVGVETYRFEDLPQAMVRLKRGELRATNAVVRITSRNPMAGC